MDSVQEKHPDPAPTVNRLRDEKGAELLQLLAGISAEGDLTKPQINGLKRWRKTVGAAGIGILESMSEIVGRIVGRGSIDQSDWLELQLVIERVLPVTERGIERKGKTWRNAPVTAMQRDYIAVLGGSLQPTAKTGAACDLIETLLMAKTVSSRQRMVLRFWGQERRIISGLRGVSRWQEEFYAEDPDRERAWELFKAENGDDGSRRDALQVPVGAGSDFLARVKRGGEDAKPKSRPADPVAVGFLKTVRKIRLSPNYIVWSGLALAAGVVAVAFFLRNAAVPVAPPVAPRAAPVRAAVAPTPTRTEAVTSQRPVEDRPPPPVTPAASPDLTAAVERIKVTGLIGGDRPRAFINGEAKRPGDVIDARRGIALFGIDTAKRTVTFVDRAGNKYTKPFR